MTETMGDYNKIITVAKVRREKETELFHTRKAGKEEADNISLSELFEELDAFFSAIEGEEQLKSIIANNSKLKFLLCNRAQAIHEEVCSYEIEEENFYLDLDEDRLVEQLEQEMEDLKEKSIDY